MSKIKIEFIDKGFKEVMFSSGTYHMIKDQAQAISDRAGEGFGYDVVKGYHGSRWIAFVHAETLEAELAETENKILSRSV